MRELLRCIIIFFLGGIVAASTTFSFLKDHEEERKNEEPGLLWIADTSKKYTDFEPGLVAFLKDTPTHKVLYAIDANEEAESYFGLYLITDSAGTTFSKLLFMAKSVEQLQEAAESLSGTNAQEGTLKLPQGLK
jgi:hypothetical protein|nr:MAG TPA: hypothetical protein [Crassvirales sp.]